MIVLLVKKREWCLEWRNEPQLTKAPCQTLTDSSPALPDARQVALVADNAYCTDPCSGANWWCKLSAIHEQVL